MYHSPGLRPRTNTSNSRRAGPAGHRQGATGAGFGLALPVDGPPETAPNCEAFVPRSRKELRGSRSEPPGFSRGSLSERQWDFIRPLLPPLARTGRPRADDRRTIEGILYVLITGCRWQDLPREYGAPTTAWRRLKRWGETGVWERIWRASLAALDQHGQLDWTMAFLDGSFVPAKKGGDQIGLTKKGKGTKWMLVVDGNGLPLGCHLDSASCAEVRIAEQTLA